MHNAGSVPCTAMGFGKYISLVDGAEFFVTRVLSVVCAVPKPRALKGRCKYELSYFFFSSLVISPLMICRPKCLLLAAYSPCISELT